MRPTDPIKLTLLDGKERGFLLSMGAIKRLKGRFKAKTVADLLTKDTEDVLVPVLFEALVEKDGLDEDRFTDLMPVDFEAISEAVRSLFGFSMPDPSPDPTLPSPETPIQ